MIVLEFTVPWRVTSNNVASRRVGRRTIANPAATRDKSRIWQIAYAEAQRVRWTMPAAAAMHVVAWNTRKDVGNIEKVIADALVGVAWPDDRILTGLHVEKKRDLDGERYDIRIEPREALVVPKPLRRMRYEDLIDNARAMLRDRPRIQDVVIVPGCLPMTIADMPAAWKTRARREGPQS